MVGKHARLRLAVLGGLFALAVGLPASAQGAAFCDTGVVRDYMKPLKSLPSLRSPITEHLPFGPRNVFFGRTGQSSLVIGAEEIGFHLSYSSIATKPTGKRLGWLVTAKLAQFDPVTAVWKAIESRRLRELELGDQKSLSFSVSGKPAIYRIEVVFRDGAGKRLARYGEYYRVLRPSLDARLVLDRSVFRPGEVVSPRLENNGTKPLFYGLSYSIESFDGSGWTRAPISPSGAVLLIGIWTGPGGSASCWNFMIPTDAPPGRYRFVWSGEVSGGTPPRSSTPLILTAEFEILPAS